MVGYTPDVPETKFGNILLKSNHYLAYFYVKNKQRNHNNHAVTYKMFAKSLKIFPKPFSKLCAKVAHLTFRLDANGQRTGTRRLSVHQAVRYSLAGMLHVSSACAG